MTAANTEQKTDKRPFRPAFGLGNAHSQSFLASFRLRKKLLGDAAKALEAASKRVELQVEDEDGPSVLECWIAEASGEKTKNAAITMIHGWEGSHESAYLYSLAARLHAQGFTVIRLNLRDHGQTHHLNKGLFHACRITETVAAIAEIKRHVADKSLYLCGFSLGGNFSLRVALAAKSTENLAGVYAISPVLNAESVTEMLDSQAGYRQYFLKKWRRSMRAKQAAHADLYDFTAALKLKSVKELLHYFVDNGYTPFSSANEYLDQYSIEPARLAETAVPITIITAADDPVVPVRHALQVPESNQITMVVTPRGGHCGFVENWQLGSYVERYLAGDIALKLADS